MQVNIQSKDGSTALIAAAIKGQVDVATFLIAHGADIYAVHSDGWTALIACADEGCFELAKILLAAGAELDVVDKEDWTALRSASQKGHYNIVKHLLNAGVDVTTPDKQGWTALHVAAGYGRVALIPLLLESGAIENIDAETKQGFSSVMVASEYGFLEVVQLLVAYGCDTTVVKEAGTLISRARMYGKAEVADWLERAAGWGPLRVVADVPLPPRIGKYLLRQGTCFLSLFSLRARALSLSLSLSLNVLARYVMVLLSAAACYLSLSLALSLYWVFNMGCDDGTNYARFGRSGQVPCRLIGDNSVVNSKSSTDHRNAQLIVRVEREPHRHLQMGSRALAGVLHSMASRVGGQLPSMHACADVRLHVLDDVIKYYIKVHIGWKPAKQ